jgi:hypothetical protein
MAWPARRSPCKGARDAPAANNFQITDCDGTTDETARVVQDEGIPVWIVVRLLGPANSRVRLICTEITVDVNDNDLCVITAENFSKSKEFTKVGTNLVDAALEGLTFELQTLNGFPVKILQFRDYERL